MFTKKAIFNLIDIQPLNNPTFDGSFVKNQNLKISSKETVNKWLTTEDNNSFDLQAEIEQYPNSLYVKCFAIKADEANDNGDYFSKNELKKATDTFVGVPVFTNHQNTDVEKARGTVVHSWWDDSKNGIMIVARVDAEAYPQLARGIKQKYVIGTSMGAQVQYSICSVCHAKAESPDQYCSHIRERKTRDISANKQKCQFFVNGTDEECPICSSTAKNIKTFDYQGKAFEYNYGIKFIENSFVVNPACHDCGVTEVIDPQEFRRKVANIERQLPSLLKAADKYFTRCEDGSCYKTSGQKELQDLNQALELISSVSKSMLDQRQQIDLEFLSDITQVLADLQGVADELTQQGYGSLPSPGESQTQETQQNTSPDGSMMPTNPLANSPGGGSKIQSGDAGEAGTVTTPLAKNLQFKLEKIGSKIKNKTIKIKLKMANIQTNTNRKIDIPFKMS